jgi:hypothetical protein
MFVVYNWDTRFYRHDAAVMRTYQSQEIHERDPVATNNKFRIGSALA